jgi:hypothetical protein
MSNQTLSYCPDSRDVLSIWTAHRVAQDGLLASVVAPRLWFRYDLAQKTSRVSGGLSGDLSDGTTETDEDRAVWPKGSLPPAAAQSAPVDQEQLTFGFS